MFVTLSSNTINVNCIKAQELFALFVSLFLLLSQLSSAFCTIPSTFPRKSRVWHLACELTLLEKPDYLQDSKPHSFRSLSTILVIKSHLYPHPTLLPPTIFGSFQMLGSEINLSEFGGLQSAVYSLYFLYFILLFLVPLGASAKPGVVSRNFDNHLSCVLGKTSCLGWELERPLQFTSYNRGLTHSY